MDHALRQLTDQVNDARHRAAPLRICGGGSKDFYGQTLQGERLDTTALNGITSYEPSELYIRAGAGTPLADIEAALAKHHQTLPFEPPHFGPGATLGGMVSAGLSGPARPSAGSVRDHVLGVSLLNAQGQQLQFGGTVMKNVAGYDVSRLLVGALGILGVVTEVSLKVLAQPVAEATLVFELDEAGAIAQLNRWGGLPLPLNASCWHADRLWVRLRGAHAAVQAAQARMGGMVLRDDAPVFWASLREQTHPFFALQPGQALWRVSVPDTTPPLGLGASLLEWGGGQRWLKHTPNFDTKLRSALVESGGHATLFRAPAEVQRTDVAVFSPLSPPLARIHRELKNEFDPVGIFNRGRFYADL